MNKEMTADVPTTEEKKPAHQKLSLRKNFSWTFAAQLIYSFARWLIILIVAKLGDATSVGLVVLAQAICMPVVWASSLNLRAALVTDARNEYTYGQYIGLRLATSLVAFVAIVGIAMLPWYDWHTKTIILIFGMGGAVLSIREMMLAIAIKNECMNVSARSDILLAFGALGAFSATYYLTSSLAAALIAVVAIRLLVLLLHDIPFGRSVAETFAQDVPSTSLRPHWSFSLLRRLCLTTLPLGMAMTLSSLNNNIPVYFLEGYHGKAATGYYGAMGSILNALMLLLNTLGTAASPRLALYFAENRRAFKRLLAKLMGIGVAAGVVGVGVALLCGRQILALAFTDEYTKYATDFVWLVGAGGVMFLVSFLIYAIIASRAFKHLLVSFAIVVPACAGLSILFIRPWGVSGAVWTRLGSAVVSLAVLAVALLLRLRSAKADAPTSPTSAEAPDRQRDGGDEL